MLQQRPWSFSRYEPGRDQVSSLLEVGSTLHAVRRSPVRPSPAYIRHVIKVNVDCSAKSRCRHTKSALSSAQESRVARSHAPPGSWAFAPPSERKEAPCPGQLRELLHGDWRRSPDIFCTAGGGSWPISVQVQAAPCPQLAKADAATAAAPTASKRQ